MSGFSKHPAPGVQQVTFMLDKEAYDLLRAYAPTPKGYGRFVSRLIFEYQVRREERQRLQQGVPTVGVDPVREVALVGTE
jgi:hypothetical protein